MSTSRADEETYADYDVPADVETILPEKLIAGTTACHIYQVPHTVVVSSDHPGAVLKEKPGKPARHVDPHAFKAIYFCPPNVIEFFLILPSSSLYSDALVDRTPQTRTDQATAGALLAATEYAQCRFALRASGYAAKVGGPGMFLDRRLTVPERQFVETIFRAAESKITNEFCGFRTRSIPTLFRANGA